MFDEEPIHLHVLCPFSIPLTSGRNLRKLYFFSIVVGFDHNSTLATFVSDNGTVWSGYWIHWGVPGSHSTISSRWRWLISTWSVGRMNTFSFRKRRPNPPIKTGRRDVVQIHVIFEEVVIEALVSCLFAKWKNWIDRWNAFHIPSIVWHRWIDAANG